MSDVSGEFLESVRASKPEPETTTEQLAEIEGQAEPVQVCEGRWRTRNGEVRNVTPTPEGDGREGSFPWWDAQYAQTWRANGRYHFGGKNSPLDLLEYLGPIELPGKTQELPGKTQELPDKTQELPGKTQELPAAYTPPEGWRLVETHEELDIPGRDQYVRGPNRYIRPIEPQPELPADTAEELRSEIHYLQRELGEAIQGRDLFAAANRRQADMIAELQNRIADLETINAAQKQAVERANRANDDLQNRLKAVAAEWAQQAETSRRLQIDLDAAQQVPADSPELRRANDKLAQLEVLQPMAAACSTAQTMVRDMLGHMRCLLALHHTTDRSNFCTLLESILEVFDDRECDDDGDETSDAEQV